MALLQVQYFSQAMAGKTSFYIALPNDVPPHVADSNPAYKRSMKTLVLLHGYSGTASSWVTGSNMCELSSQYNLAIITPEGRNSFYIDKPAAGEKYETLVGDEILDYARKTFGLSDKAEDTFIGGLSMGGFGAIRTALAHPQNYSKIIAFSSALIVTKPKDITPENPNSTINNNDAVFEAIEDAYKASDNPEELVSKLLDAGRKMPEIYMACGSEDFLIEANREFSAFLQSKNIDHEFHVSPGIHNWKFWNEYLELGIKWVLGIN